MKAAIFHGGGRPLTFEEWPTPEAGPGELVVRVSACGLCHTDLHYLDHGVPTFKTPPIILGHEAAGHITQIGGNVRGWTVGQPVLLPAVFTCGACTMCGTGRANICEKMLMLGNHTDGAFAEYIKVPAREVIALPADLDPVEMAIVGDAVTTAYHAVVNRTQVRAGDRVAIFGCGGVGLSAVQFAAMQGAHVTAVDLEDAKLAIARDLGAADTVNPRQYPETVKELKRRSGGGMDRTMECIGNPVTIQQAQGALRTGGRLTIVGFCGKAVELSAAKIMFQEQEVIGSLGCRPADFPRVIDLIRQGRFRLAPLVTARRPLSELPQALDDLRAGRGIRTVILP